MTTIIVTGATDGIGLQTAKQLQTLCTNLIVHSRNERKAEKLVADLSEESSSATIIPVWGDLSVMQEVVELADQILSIGLPVDCLVNNAGVYTKHRKKTADGFEKTMAVNYFSAYLLTRRILPALEQAPKARIVNVSSMTHDGAIIDPNDLNLTQNWTAYDAYSISKLANVLFSMALADRLLGLGITSNALHPGVVTTKLLRDAFSMTGISTADGAKTSIHLATSPDVDGVTGEYFVDCRRTTPSKVAHDEGLITDVWDRTETLLSAYLSG